MHGYPPQRGRLTLPILSKSCLAESELEGTPVARWAQSIFYQRGGDSASVLSLSCAYTWSRHGQRQSEKDPSTPSSSPALLFTPSYCLCYIVIYHIVSRVHRYHQILPPDHVKWVYKNFMSQKCFSTFEIQNAQGLFFLLTSRTIWLAASSAATSRPHSTLV